MSEYSGSKSSNFSYLHRAFAETEHGQFLAQQTRWDRYRPVDVSPERWREVLGVDINNLGHLLLSGNLTRLFIRNMDKTRPGYFSDEDKVVLEVTAFVHDWPESIVGDTNYHHKTADHDEEEKAVFKQNLQAFYPGCSPEMEAIINRAIDEVIYAHDDEGLARVFNVIERLGYVRTPLRGVKNIISGSAPDCERDTRRMIGDTFSVHVTSLIENSEEFPPVEDFLRGKQDHISIGFDLVDDQAFANLHSDEVRAKFLDSKTAWAIWSSSDTPLGNSNHKEYLF